MYFIFWVCSDRVGFGRSGAWRSGDLAFATSLDARHCVIIGSSWKAWFWSRLIGSLLEVAVAVAFEDWSLRMWMPIWHLLAWWNVRWEQGHWPQLAKPRTQSVELSTQNPEPLAGGISILIYGTGNCTHFHSQFFFCGNCDWRTSIRVEFYCPSHKSGLKWAGEAQRVAKERLFSRRQLPSI